ncbi:hypothetical protein D9M69_730040 [compost metagenome]
MARLAATVALPHPSVGAVMPMVRHPPSRASLSSLVRMMSKAKAAGCRRWNETMRCFSIQRGSTGSGASRAQEAELLALIGLRWVRPLSCVSILLSMLMAALLLD